MSTLRIPRERNEWFRDRDGVWTTSKDRDSVDGYTIDFSTLLATGETITAEATDASGVTVTAEAADAAANTVILGISGTDGHVKITLTTSTGRTLVQYVRFLGTPLPSPEKDYRR